MSFEEIIAVAVREQVQREFAKLHDELPVLIRRATESEWLNSAEVEKLLNVTGRQLYNLRSQGKLEYSQRGRRIIYPRESVEDYIERGRVRRRVPE